MVQPVGANGFNYILQILQTNFIKDIFTMKKNKIMRIASVLLVAVLLSISAISGTFAKYVSTAEKTETARVAKWGVNLEVTGSSFNTQYKIAEAATDPANNAIIYSVDSSNSNNVVAPGTKDNGGVTFTISGEPEVATKVEITMDVKSDVFVKKAEEDDVYCPVVFTLQQTKGKYVGEDNTLTDITDPKQLAKGTLTDIKNALAECAGTYAPKTNIAAEYKLTWEWAFDNNDGANDENDTLLGDLAAKDQSQPVSINGVNYEKRPGTDAAGNYVHHTFSTNIEYTITLKITQVD